MGIYLESNIAFTMQCPLCNEKLDISLDMLQRNEIGGCSNCKTPMVITLEKSLKPVVSDSNVLY